MTESLQKDQKMPLVLVQGASRGVSAFGSRLSKTADLQRKSQAWRMP